MIGDATSAAASVPAYSVRSSAVCRMRSQHAMSRPSAATRAIQLAMVKPRPLLTSRPVRLSPIGASVRLSTVSIPR